MAIPIQIVISATDATAGAFAAVKRGVIMLGSALAELGGGFADVGRIISGFAVGPIEGLSAAFGSAIKVAKDVFGVFVSMESQLAKVVAATGLTGEAAEQMAQAFRETAETIGPEFGKTTAETLQSLESLVKAGLSGEDAITALTGAMQLSTIEGINMGDAADMVVQSLGMFALSADEASRVTDALVNASLKGIATASEFAIGLGYMGKTAASFGWSIEEATAALVMLNNQGITAEKSGRYLDSLFRDLIEKSDKLGFSIYDQSGKMLSLTQIIAGLETRLASFGTEQERNAYLASVFDAQSSRAALALVSMTAEGQQGSEALAELTAAMGTAGSAATATETQLATTGGAMAQMQAKVTALQERIGEALAHAVTQIAEAFMNFLGVLERTGIIDLFVGAITALCNAFTWLINLVGRVVNALQPLWDAIAAGANFVGDVIRSIFGGSPGVIPDAFNASVSAAQRATKEIGGCFRHISDQAYGAIPGINALQNSINALQSKTVTITTVYQTVGGGGGETGALRGLVAAAAPAPAPYVPAIPRSLIAQRGGEALLTRPTWILGGEAGPERATFEPIGGGGVAGGITVNINNPQIGSDYDVERMADKMQEVLRRRMLAHGRMS